MLLLIILLLAHTPTNICMVFSTWISCPNYSRRQLYLYYQGSLGVLLCTCLVHRYERSFHTVVQEFLNDK